MDTKAIQNEVTQLLKNSDEEQKQTLRVFLKMPLESRIKIFAGHKKTFYTLKDEHRKVDPSLLSYGALILAINQYVNNLAKIDKNTLDLRTKSIRKFAKREKLLAKWALIKELKNVKGLSFRQITKYLKKYHKLEVVHSTVYDLWKELEENKRGEQ
ncbi:MAG: hypothetical protein DRG78_04230 [Epsilonproteobacteria bacterium]|nr:MAG: hypothetical protein DRG78_04230 [Campylobacterota bacterium]